MDGVCNLAFPRVAQILTVVLIENTARRGVMCRLHPFCRCWFCLHERSQENKSSASASSFTSIGQREYHYDARSWQTILWTSWSWCGVRSWKTSLVLWSRRIMACSLNGIESSRRILNNGVGVNRILLAEAIPTWYPHWQSIHMINLR